MVFLVESLPENESSNQTNFSSRFSQIYRKEYETLGKSLIRFDPPHRHSSNANKGFRTGNFLLYLKFAIMILDIRLIHINLLMPNIPNRLRKGSL